MDASRAHSFEDMALQVWTARPDGQLDYVNAFTVAYFGVSREKILDEGWKDVCHSLDLITAGQRWRHCLATGEDYEVHFRLLRGSDRSYRWHLGRAVAVRDANGEISHWVGTNTDIDRLRREMELAESRASRLER
ncbi:MAG: PAS domain-containing protein [Arenimonas sp.]